MLVVLPGPDWAESGPLLSTHWSVTRDLGTDCCTEFATRLGHPSWVYIVRNLPLCRYMSHDLPSLLRLEGTRKMYCQYFFKFSFVPCIVDSSLARYRAKPGTTKSYLKLIYIIFVCGVWQANPAGHDKILSHTFSCMHIFTNPFSWSRMWHRVNS